MEVKQLNARVSPELYAALDVLHRRYRINKTAAVEMALRDLLARYDVPIAQPDVDTDVTMHGPI
jgi:hypothetical protein